MAVADRIEWRRRFPCRACRRLAWFAALGGFATASGYVLFGGEPIRLASGQINLLALIPTGLAVLSVIGTAPFALAIFRRPLVGVDRYALLVRPGILRTLLLPWAKVDEIAAYGVRDDAFFLVRCRGRADWLGDRPGWWDRFALRAVAARRDHPGAGRRAAIMDGYDVAVRMSDFVGDPAAQLAAIAVFAPRHVTVADDLTEPELRRY